MYTAKDIRNIALLGHGGDGKSALCESMLFNTKVITRLGKRADGTTVSDFDEGAIRDSYREKDIYYIKPEDLHVCMTNFEYVDGTKKKTVCLCEMWFEDIYVSVPLDGYSKYWFLDKKEAEFYHTYYLKHPYENGEKKDDE